MNELNCPGIYRFTCTPNGKVYVGRSVNVAKRVSHHFVAAKTKNLPIYQAIRKYGRENFTVDLLERVDDPAQLIPREQFWIDTLRAAEREHGYNLCPHGDGPLGFKHGPEMRAKMSARKGEKRPPVSAETRKRMSETVQAYWKDRPRKVKPPKPSKSPPKIKPTHAAFGSAEHRAKMSAAQKRRTDRQNPEYIARQREAQLKRWANRPPKPPKPKPPKMTQEKNLERMHEAKRLNDERRKAERIERFQSFIAEHPGAAVDQVADFFAISQNSAYRLMKEAGYKRNQSKQDALKAYLLERKNQWTTLKELAARFETTTSKIHSWLRLEGFVKKGGRWQIPKKKEELT